MPRHFVDDAASDYRYYGDMSKEAFIAWLTAMQISGAKAARLLGVSPNAITRYKRKGGTKMLALACSALFHRLKEWKE